MTSKTMFTRIMAVITAVILLLTAGISAVFSITLRNQQINARLDDLIRDAQDIAYLASQNTASNLGLAFSGKSSTLAYLQQKAAAVYEAYGAYILVVDRRGRQMDNLSVTYADNPEFAKSLSAREISEAFMRVLGGEVIRVRATLDGKPTFTVGVPFLRDGAVLGAVLVQTQALNIEGRVWVWLWPVLLMAIVGTMLAAVCIFLYVRTVMKPLHEVTTAARAMADGDFSTRVQLDKTTPETEELSRAFNLMADKLGQTEQSRREFVANVSHELRSPITSISGFVTGMEDGTIPLEEHGRYLSIVGDETRRLSKLIGDLLALSRLERDDAVLDYTDFDMCELFRRCVINRMKDLEAKHLEIECDFQADPCMVHADSDRIQQVVVNLLDNAIKFTPDTGIITLSTEEEGAHRYRLRVRDNGTGILPEDRPHVFDRFFTADRAHTSGKGTGLGLAISQRILEMHAQQITLDPTTEGASFSFTLERTEGT